ncbi:hypothetical protein HYI36_18615 [Bacillus sp. Gen3]|nr:hypothetical protein [Bacillus sp. Gen3]
MATNTTNYNLKKPAQEDFYNIDDHNGNMDIIDNQMKKTEDVLVGHEKNEMPHLFTDGTKKYKYGFKTNTAKDGLIFIYEEVI